MEPFRDRIVLATKFSPFALPGQNMPEGKLSRSGVRSAVEDSLRRLRTDYIDLYYEHRVPDDETVEDVAFWMGELIAEGKIRGWGQSQSTESQIRRAHAVTPLAAVQSEYSIMERMFEKDVIPACAELGIGFVAFSPLASGFLSGRCAVNAVYQGDDVRRVITRFEPGNMAANEPILTLLRRVAEDKGATPAQISLAWMLHGRDFVVPIPGMRREERIVENLGAADVELSRRGVRGSGARAFGHGRTRQQNGRGYRTAGLGEGQVAGRRRSPRRESGASMRGAGQEGARPVRWRR